MIRRALAGLRGRLLAALVFTSAVTLAVAAAIMLSPLQSRLRAESADALRQATFNERLQLETALPRRAPSPDDERKAIKDGDLRRGVARSAAGRYDR